MVDPEVGAGAAPPAGAPLIVRKPPNASAQTRKATRTRTSRTARTVPAPLSRPSGETLIWLTGLLLLKNSRRHQAQTACQQAVPAALESVAKSAARRSEEHTSELQSLRHLVCRLLLE